MLGANSIGERGALYLAAALEKNTSLQLLDLSNAEEQLLNFDLEGRENKISNEGLKSIFKALEQNTTLRTLNLQANKISSAGIISKEFMRSILKCHLHRLDLSNNSLGDDGIKYLCWGLLHNQNLQQLYLENTGITESGFGPLYHLIRHNSSIKTLNLNRNKLGETSGRHLGSLLCENTTLENLQLDSCEIGWELVYLVLALKVNKTLKTINVSNNFQDGHMRYIANKARESLAVNIICERFDFVLISRHSPSLGVNACHSSATIREVYASDAYKFILKNSEVNKKGKLALYQRLASVVTMLMLIHNSSDSPLATLAPELIFLILEITSSYCHPNGLKALRNSVSKDSENDVEAGNELAKRLGMQGLFKDVVKQETAESATSSVMVIAEDEQDSMSAEIDTQAEVCEKGL